MPLQILPIITAAVGAFQQSSIGQKKIPGFAQNVGELMTAKTTLFSGSPLIAIGVSLLSSGDNLGHLYIFMGAGFIFLRDTRYREGAAKNE